MKNVILCDINLSGLAQGLGENVKIHALASVMLKSYCSKFEVINENYKIDIIAYKVTDDISILIKKIIRINPFVVGFSCYTWNFVYIKQVIEKIKNISPKIKILLGGPEVSYISKELMEKYSYIDYIISGYGEIPFKNLLLYYLNMYDIQKIKSFTYRKNERIIVNKGSYYIELNDIPSPFQNNLIKLDTNEKHAVYLETFRGCPMKCGYCMWGNNLNKLQSYSLNSILKDIEIIYNNPNIENVYITDAFLFYIPQRAYKILKKIILSKYLHPTFLEFDLLALKKEYLPYLTPVCKSDYRLGIQSFKENVLTESGRKVLDKSKIIEKINMIRGYDKNAKISFALIFGLPEDSLKGFKETLSFALLLKPDSLKINILAVLPGTDFWVNFKKYGLVYEEEAPHRLIYSKDFTKEDLMQCSFLSNWIIYILQFDLIKNFIYDLIDNQKMDNPIKLIEQIIFILEKKEVWMKTLHKKIGISVEEENKIRIKIIDRARLDISKYNIYKAILQIFDNENIKSNNFYKKIDSEIKYYLKFNHFKIEEKDRLWKR